MSLDLIISQGQEIIDPVTGEAYLIADAPDDVVARVLGSLQRDIGDLMDAKRWLGREAIRRMDANALWTIHASGVKVTAPSAVEERVTWDAELLHEILDQAVADELISREAALRACSTKVEHVTHAAGIKALERLPAMAARIAKARRTEPAPDRNVRVSVTG